MIDLIILSLMLLFAVILWLINSSLTAELKSNKKHCTELIKNEIYDLYRDKNSILEERLAAINTSIDELYENQESTEQDMQNMPDIEMLKNLEDFYEKLDDEIGHVKTKQEELIRMLTQNLQLTVHAIEEID